MNDNKTMKRKWRFIFVFVIIMQIVDEALSLIFQHYWESNYLSDILLSILILFLLLYLLERVSRTTEELEQSKNKLNSIFDTMDVAIWSHDLRTNRLLISPGIEKLYGHSLEEFYSDHNLWKKGIVPEDIHVLTTRDEELSLGKPITSIYRIIRPDGKLRWIQDRGIPTLDESGQFVDFTSVLFDITDRMESEDRYRSLVEMSPDFISVIIDERFVYINRTGSKLIGASGPDELIGQHISKISTQEDIDAFKRKMLEAKQDEKEKIRFEFKARRLDGSYIDVELNAMPIHFLGRPAYQMVGRDVTQRKETEKMIHQMAYYDALTNLPNRNMFKAHLHKALHKSTHPQLAVLFLDLDRFKIINDTRGHAIGDLILKQVAFRLEAAVGTKGLVSRQGGDEFIILLEELQKEEIAKIASKIMREFSTPLKLNNEEFFVTSSIGISIFPDDGIDEETLIKHADTAMYLAKEKGKNNFQFYDPELDQIAERKLELEHGLRKAIDQEQLLLLYQPQVDLTTGKIIGTEALVRWDHPEYGMISPSEFIPLAEETGLIVPLGNWVLKKACEQNKAWHDKGYSPIPIAVNLSIRQIQDEQFVKYVKDILEEIDLHPLFLDLEITESLFQNIEKSSFILNQLKQLGVRLSIDDFGTGYSSLSYLKHLPIDTIKIDKSFVDDITEHASQGSIVKAIIDMSLNLNFNVLAEGIENEEQVQYLLENSCLKGQGYYFSKPLTVEQMEAALAGADWRE